MDGFFHIIVEQFSAIGNELSVRARPPDHVLVKKYGKNADAFFARLRGLGMTARGDLEIWHDEASRAEIIHACALYCQQTDTLRDSMFGEEDAGSYDPLVSKHIDECVKKTFGVTDPEALSRLRPVITEQYRGPVIRTLAKHFDGLPQTSDVGGQKKPKKTAPPFTLSDEQWKGASPLQRLVALVG